MFLDVFKERDKARRAFFVFIISAVLVSLNCIFQLIFGFDFFRGKEMIDMGNGVFALGISFNNYNDLAAYLIISISIFVSLVLRKDNKVKIYLLWLIILFSVFSLIFTFSRGGWVGFLAAIIFMLILSGQGKKTFLLLGFAILLILIIPPARGFLYF